MLTMLENPPQISPWASSPRCFQGDWWVAHTLGRFEKAFAWDLLRKGVNHFLPMVQRVRYSGGRKRRVMLPLFPSYVFFNGSLEQRSLALATDRLCQVIAVADQATLAEQLEAIHLALCVQPQLSLHDRPAVGQRCRVKAGPLMGFEGVVVEHGRMARTVLEVSILGQGAVVEIDADLLEPAG